MDRGAWQATVYGIAKEFKIMLNYIDIDIDTFLS